WNAFEVPDVGDGCSQFDVTHPVTANFGAGDFYTAALTNDALITDSFVFTAVAFPVAGWAGNAFTKQSVFFGFAGAIVCSVRVFVLTIGQSAKCVGAGVSDGQ